MKKPPSQFAPLASTLIRKVFAVYFALAFGITLIQLGVTYRNTARQVMEEMDAIARAFEPGIALAVWNYQEELVKSVALGMLDGTIVVEVHIQDASSKLNVMVKGKTGAPSDPGMTKKYNLTYRPYPGREEAIGSMTLYSSYGVVVDRVKYSLLLIAAVALIKTIGLWLIILYFANRLLAHPLRRFTEQIGSVDFAQNKSLEPGKVKSKELVYLYDAFNKMTSELFEKRQALVGLAAELERRVDQRTAELNDKNMALQAEVEERQKAEAALKKAQEDLISTARRAGMAEVATNVLHNVGNVLNSVNVSTNVIRRKVGGLKVFELSPVIDLLEKNQEDLGQFVASEKGKLVPVYLRKISEALSSEQKAVIDELNHLTYSVEHLKHIIALQQERAGVSSIAQPARIGNLIDDALRISMEAMARHNVKLFKQFDEGPLLMLDKSRILQILVNLISNAIRAMHGTPLDARHLTIRTEITEDSLIVSVRDRGEGIAPDNLTRIFAHGFTTRNDGHGFGLHSSINAAKEMGGNLTAHSDGPQQGALFTLTLPIKAPAESS